MICRIAEFLLENNYPVKGEIKLHAKECRHNACVEKGECQCFSDINRNLTSLTFGWNLSMKLVISDLEDIQVSELKDVDLILKIIHPVKNTIWIARHISDDGEFHYTIISDGKTIQCASLGEANYQLKDVYDYNGHKLEDSWYNE